MKKKKNEKDLELQVIKAQENLAKLQKMLRKEHEEVLFATFDFVLEDRELFKSLRNYTPEDKELLKDFMKDLQKKHLGAEKGNE